MARIIAVVGLMALALVSCTMVATAPPTPVPTPTTPPSILYQPAMRPEFSHDIEMVMEAGVSQYELSLSIPPAELANPTGVHLTGQAVISYTNTETAPLTDIYLRLYPNLIGYGGTMTLETVSVEGQSVQPELTAENSAARIPLLEPLASGDGVTLTVDYQLTVPTNVGVGYNIFSYTEGVLALAGFYPTIAVYDEHGWNVEIPPPHGDATYHDVALYQLSLTAPATLTVVASGTQIEQESLADGQQRLTFVSGPMRDFYLALSANYQVSQQTVDGITVRSYYGATQVDGGEAVLGYGVEAVRLFNQSFGSYPYAELDLVSTPTRAGGVEYPGVVVVAQGLYEKQGEFLQYVVGHEVAHQWWYGVVGNNQIREPWLDESLTQYSTLLYWQAVNPTVATHIAEDYFYRPYHQAQELGHDRPVAGAVADFSEADYGMIVYGKGPLFFLALHEEMGDEIFYEVVQSYYSEYKYKLASADDLVATIEDVYGHNITTLYNDWIVGQ